MKLLLENWREYLTEATEEELGPVMQAIWQEWTNYLKGWN